MPTITVALDYMNLFHRSLHVHGALSHRGQPTGALFGVAMQIATSIIETRATQLFLCMDTRPYFREKLYPQYKQGRRKTERSEEDMLRFASGQQQCQDFFETIGLKVLSVPGWEADDLMAVLAHEYENVVAASNDTDLYQLLGKNEFKLYRGKERGFYTMDDFIAEFDLYPEDWAKVIMYMGSHNGMPGIPGVGIKTAIRLVKDPKYCGAQTAKFDLLNRAKMLRANLRAAQLPFVPRGGITFEKPENAFLKRYDYRKLVRFMNSYGIQVTATMREAFERVNGK